MRPFMRCPLRGVVFLPRHPAPMRIRELVRQPAFLAVCAFAALVASPPRLGISAYYARLYACHLMLNGESFQGFAQKNKKYITGRPLKFRLPQLRPSVGAILPICTYPLSKSNAAKIPQKNSTMEKNVGGWVGGSLAYKQSTGLSQTMHFSTPPLPPWSHHWYVPQAPK